MRDVDAEAQPTRLHAQPGREAGEERVEAMVGELTAGGRDGLRELRLEACPLALERRLPVGGEQGDEAVAKRRSRSACGRWSSGLLAFLEANTHTVGNGSERKRYVVRIRALGGRFAISPP